ncbi:MAG: zinc-ribbon and DUF3426 domain-containing protein [Pseudomonadota bacterium]
MSLATRCAACGTVFRVVQDQLKVSEGWVRCGRCGDVFNALEGLFDLERESAPSWTPSQRGPLDLLPASADEHAAQLATRPESPADDSVEHGEAGVVSESVDDTQIDTHVDSHIETRQIEHEDVDSDAVGRGELSDFEDPVRSDLGTGAVEPEPAPSFLRQSDQAGRWQQPRVKLALSVAAGLLGLLLAVQAALWQRDTLAARWPEMAPLLAQLCEPIGCRIEPLRHLDGLAVESSGLSQIDSASTYRLQVALRNRDVYPLLMPALDVTLTDSRGEVVARKVLSRSDFGPVAPETLAAGAEQSLQAVLDAGERRITGYSIEIFYP